MNKNDYFVFCLFLKDYKDYFSELDIRDDWNGELVVSFLLLVLKEWISSYSGCNGSDFSG